MNELTAEIFAVGKWNGTDVTRDMLVELANNFSRLSDIVDVPLKFGHNDEQPMTDGQPALGWVSKVWVEGEKLLAKFTDIPEIVYNAIEKKQYKNVSIEALFDVEHKGIKYGTVLTAVALLGVDMPAVNTLKDLTTYMTNKNLAFSSHATFSKKPSNINSEKHMGMSPEEQAEFDAMKKSLSEVTKTMADDRAKFTTKQAELEAENKALKEEKEATTFAREKQDVENDLETLVKENKITPAQRDSLTKQFTAETAAQVKFTIATLKENTAMGNSDQQGREDKDNGTDDSGMTPDEKVTVEALKFQANNKGTFSAAVQHVLSTDPKLAREYADFNDAEV